MQVLGIVAYGIVIVVMLLMIKDLLKTMFGWGEEEEEIQIERGWGEGEVSGVDRVYKIIRDMDSNVVGKEEMRKCFGLMEMVFIMEGEPEYDEVFQTYGDILGNVERSIEGCKRMTDGEVPEEIQEVVMEILMKMKNELEYKKEIRDEKDRVRVGKELSVIAGVLRSDKNFLGSRETYFKRIYGNGEEYSLEKDIAKTIKSFQNKGGG